MWSRNSLSGSNTGCGSHGSPICRDPSCLASGSAPTQAKSHSDSSTGQTLHPPSCCVSLSATENCSRNKTHSYNTHPYTQPRLYSTHHTIHILIQCHTKLLSVLGRFHCIFGFVYRDVFYNIFFTPIKQFWEGLYFLCCVLI